MRKFILAAFCAIIALTALSCKKEVEIPVVSVSISQLRADMVAGDAVQLSATVQPSNATDQTVVWSSSKQSVATVSSSGVVIAISEGFTTITATAGGKFATCIVSVSPRIVDVSAIELNYEELTLEKGASETLVARVKPDDATDKKVSWSSSSKTIADVNSEGIVTAKAAGEAFIIARAGGKEARCKVKVIVPASAIILNKTSLSLDEGESETLIASVEPVDATDKSVTWESSNAQIATVDSEGKVTGVKEGTATIIAKQEGIIAKCEVTVNPPYIPVSEIILSKTELTIDRGSSETLVATVKPDNASNKSVSWSSSKKTIVKVSSEGVVTAVAAGEAIVTARSGDVEAKCKVTVTIPASSITLNKSSLSLSEGESETLIATILPSDATDKTVIWSSSNTQIATVDSEGKVTGIRAGTATIIAQQEEVYAECEVTVNPPYVPVSEITLNKTELTLDRGSAETLIATIKPDNATEKNVSWSSSKKTVVKVSSDGEVTAVAAGEAIVTARSGNVEAKCKVTVIVPVSSITLNKSSLSLEAGKSVKLTATILPSDATDKSVIWSSSDTQIAVVDSQGNVSGIKAGTATIFVRHDEIEARCEVTVIPQYIPVSGISLNQSSVEINKGKTTTLIATVTPDNATEPEVTWSSSNESVATVDQNGKVTAINGGKANIVAKAGIYSAKCEIKVTVPVTGVSLNNTYLSLKKGQTSVLTATVYPDNASNKALSWTSSNTNVATVTDGKVTAVNAGSAEIIVRTNDGGYEAVCSVNVQVPVTGVSLNITSIQIYKNDEAQLTATVYPSNAFDKSVTWSSNRPSIVSVSSSGKITGLSGGGAVITVKTTDGGFKATCNVTVIDDGHEAVDLGLSVKWATANYGTSSSTSTGGYYLWGDGTNTGLMPSYTAPNVNSVSGTDYDIVHRNWGGKWRIPTRTELGELFTKCTWKKETVGGVSVFRVTGPNGNSIIVPHTGLAYPASGNPGTTQIMSKDRAYLMSGTSYSDGTRFVYVYYCNDSLQKNWESYNVNYVKLPIRPVR